MCIACLRHLASFLRSSDVLLVDVGIACFVASDKRGSVVSLSSKCASPAFDTFGFIPATSWRLIVAIVRVRVDWHPLSLNVSKLISKLIETEEAGKQLRSRPSVLMTVSFLGETLKNSNITESRSWFIIMAAFCALDGSGGSLLRVFSFQIYNRLGNNNIPCCIRSQNAF